MPKRFESDDNRVSIPPETPQAPEHEADRDRKLGLSMLAKVALGAVIIASLVISITCVMKANQLQKQYEEMEGQVDAYEEDIKKLIYDINRNADDEYIAEQAKEFYNRYFPDEDLYYNNVND